MLPDTAQQWEPPQLCLKVELRGLYIQTLSSRRRRWAWIRCKGLLLVALLDRYPTIKCFFPLTSEPLSSTVLVGSRTTHIKTGSFPLLWPEPSERRWGVTPQVYMRFRRRRGLECTVQKTCLPNQSTAPDAKHLDLQPRIGLASCMDSPNIFSGSQAPGTSVPLLAR